MDEIDINVLKENKSIIVKILKSIGKNNFDDIVSTKEVKKVIPNHWLTIIHIITNETIRIFLIILDIILLMILVFIEYNIKSLLSISKIILYTISLLLITNIFISLYSKGFTHEWNIINHVLNYYNYIIIYHELIYFSIMVCCIISYIIIKKLIKR